MIGVVSFVIVFSLLIFVHEFGHFITAKLSGVTVDEFGFGYPPRLVQLGTWRGTAITLNWLPVGGFTRMSEDDPSVAGSLAGKPRLTRALVYVAGSLMNVVLAIILFSATFMLGTLMPVDAPGAGIYFVSAKSPAELAGFEAGDTIVMIDGQTIASDQQARDLIKAKIGQELTIQVRRNDKLLPPVKATPRVNPPENEGALGVALGQPLAKVSYPVWRAVPMGFAESFNTIKRLFQVIEAAIRKQLPAGVVSPTGPIGIYVETTKVVKMGLAQLLEFAAVLSMNLFLVNLLPLPALDGGRLIFVLLEWVRGGRKVPPEKEGLVHAIGMIFLLFLMAIVTFFDILRFIVPYFTNYFG